MYKGGKTKTIKEEFEARKSYKKSAAKRIKDHVIDTWYENPNYGFFNQDFEVVLPSVGSNFENLSSFGDHADPAQKALPFVVTAFEQFRKKFMERAESPSFNIPSYLGSVTPVKSYESFSDKYQEYINDSLSKLNLNSYSRRESRLRAIIDNSKVYPLTQTGFCLSRHCPVSTTGLAIDLATLSHDTDSIKGEILKTDTYYCFAQDALSSGFYIDKNNPWRLLANVYSEPIKSIVKLYKQTTTVENTLNRFFRKKSHFEDLASVQFLFSNLGLTTEQLIEYTLRIRMAEIDAPDEDYEKVAQQAVDIYRVYKNNYPTDPLKGPSSIIGEYCSNILKTKYLKRVQHDSYKNTRMKDLV